MTSKISKGGLMKDSARLAISIIFVSPLLMFSVLMLNGNSVALSADTPTSSSATTADGSSSASQKSAEKQKRIQDRKDKLQTELSLFQKNRLKQVCKLAQVKIGVVSANAKQVSTNRTERYNNIVSRLDSLGTKLKANQIDTTEYDKNVTDLKSLMAGFQTKLNAYNLVLSDLSDMDCQTDPEGFRASIEEAKSDRQSLVDDSVKIHTLIKQKIKTSLTDIKQALITKNNTTNAVGNN